VSKSSFKTAIGDYRAALARVVRKGFEEYFEVYGAHAACHSKRSRASLIHDLMIKHAKKELPEKEFHYIVMDEREIFSFRGEFLIQFKKLKHSMVGSNYPTAQALLFEEDGEIEGLPGIATKLPLITVGYVPRQYFSGIEGIFATQTVEHRPQWVDRLTDEEDGQLPISSILKPQHDPSSQIQKSRIKRKDKKQQSDTDTGLSRG
jgi:hypothetical protein